MIQARRDGRIVGFIVFLFVPGILSGQSNEPAEVYSFNTLGLAGAGADSFLDRDAGDDMLPYTADDRALPDRGNVGGTWGFAHLDADSDGAIGDEEHAFVVIRRGDDDTFSFSAASHPEYGVIYEAEDWTDYHDSSNAGPSATLTGDLGAEGNDFEINDRPPWESESNAYLYNNLRADQHGKGKPRYYVEHINPGSVPAATEDWVYDEIEGYRKPLNFQHNLDDPTTGGFDEKGDCRRDWFRTFDAVTRGYLIPVSDLSTLEDGSLPSLFGWETVDLAAWLRDTIAPKLGSDDLTIFHPSSGDPRFGLPITHVFLYQVEASIAVNVEGTCGSGDAQAAAMAACWGLPPEGATVRVSHLLGYADGRLADLFGPGNVRSWIEEPDDGAVRNLWLLDHFFRKDSSHLGRYSFEPQGVTYTIEGDPNFQIIDQTNNRVMRTSGGGAVRAPLARPLDAGEMPIDLVVDVGTALPEASTTFQLALMAGDEVRVQAELGLDASALRFGGAIDGATGLITGGDGVENGSVPEPGSEDGSEYTRFVLHLAPEGATLLQGVHGDYDPSDFTRIGEADLEVLAALAFGPGECDGIGGIDGVAVSLDGPGAISTIALLADPPGTSTCPEAGSRQRPGDCNVDGKLDLSDGICVLGHLFLGRPETLACGDGTRDDPANLALMDADGSGKINLTDAIRLFQYLFLGGTRPANCVDADPLRCLDCVEIPGCPDNPNACQ